jgi:hypothetical protein
MGHGSFRGSTTEDEDAAFINNAHVRWVLKENSEEAIEVTVNQMILDIIDEYKKLRQLMPE